MIEGRERKDLCGETGDGLGLVPVSTKTGRERTRARDEERELRRQFRLHRLDPILWYIHFGDVVPEEAACGECLILDFGLCPGRSLPRRPVC
jgi:hypothetical protein